MAPQLVVSEPWTLPTAPAVAVTLASQAGVMDRATQLATANMLFDRKGRQEWPVSAEEILAE